MMLSCSAALNPFMTLIPPNVSVSLPVTSAFILPRALKIGRIILNAYERHFGLKKRRQCNGIMHSLRSGDDL